MNTLTIELTNDKAYKLLKDMEELNLIRVLKSNNRANRKKASDISVLRLMIKTPMGNKEIEKQMNSIRKEWQRDI